MTKKQLKILIVVFVVIFLFFIVKVISPFAKSLFYELSRSKIEKFTKMPADYIKLFKTETQDSVVHINSISPVDNSNFPVTRIQIYSYQLAIFKFKNTQAINRLLKIEELKTKRTRIVGYTPLSMTDLGLNYSSDLKKEIDFIHLYTEEFPDTLVLSENYYIGRGKLKTLAFKFSEKDNSNVIFVENENILRKGKEYSIIILKKNGFIYLLFLIPNSEERIKIEEVHSLLKIEIPPLSARRSQ